MKSMLTITVAFLVLAFPTVSSAALDLDQPLLHIPDTHETKAYQWPVRRDPAGYQLTVHPAPGGDYQLLVTLPHGQPVRQARILAVDRGLDHLWHLQPAESSATGIRFRFAPPVTATYRLEVVLATGDGWVNLGKTIRLRAADRPQPGIPSPPEEYQIEIKRFPQTVYADHVVTLVYQLHYQGKPVSELESMGEENLLVASWASSWFTPFGEFVYATPQERLTGPEVGVSMVFHTAGAHTVFALLRHRGTTMLVATRILVREEPQPVDDGTFSFSNGGEVE